VRAELKDSELLKELDATELHLSLEEMLRQYQDELKEKLRREGKVWICVESYVESHDGNTKYGDASGG
jgi:hypothetical protein